MICINIPQNKLNNKLIINTIIVLMNSCYYSKLIMIENVCQLIALGRDGEFCWGSMVKKKK